MKTQWKHRLTHTGLLAALVTMSLGGVSASAAETNETQVTLTEAAVTASPAVKPAAALLLRQGSSSMLLQPAFQRNYLKLLASTYAPDTIDAWKTAIDERKQVEGEMLKPVAGKRVMILNKADAMGTVASAVSATGEKDSPESLKPDQLPSIAMGEGKQVTIVKSQDGVVFKNFTQDLPIEIKLTEAAKAAISEAFNRQKKLAEAVDADDAAAIRSLLPDLLKDYQKETENLRDMAKKIKEAGDAVQVQPAEPTVQAQPTE